MKIINIIFIPISIFIFNGCYAGTYTYETFEYNRNSNIGWAGIPNANKKYREVYSEDKYIYKYERPKGCHYGYLTNRDDKPEKVIGWIILSGKEYCKEQKNYSF
jgi:hypothetical protein